MLASEHGNRSGPKLGARRGGWQTRRPMDVIVATGDLIDYLHETDDDPQGLGNAGFLRDLILGRAPGPDWPVVEELRVPILMTPGNHDYRRHPYHLVFDAQIAGQDVYRIRNFSNLALLHSALAAPLRKLTRLALDCMRTAGEGRRAELAADVPPEQTPRLLDFEFLPQA